MSVIFRKSETTTRYGKLVSFKVALSSILVIHFFGALGLIYPPTRPYFEAATPLNLLITALLLFSFHYDWNRYFLAFAIVTFTTGFLIEVAGVQTGLIFGDYRYGPTLGFKIWDVPLIIGLNWLILIYCTGMLAQQFSHRWWLKSILGSAMMICLDFFIEPVAVSLDFWHWAGGEIPIHNFIGWFITALFLQVLFHLFDFKKNNFLAKYVFYVQLVFFIFLHIII